MKVNVLASREEGFHVDTLDLYAARPRAVFVKLAAVEMGPKEDLVKRDLGAGVFEAGRDPGGTAGEGARSRGFDA